MKQGLPTRPVETGRECPECGERAVQRVGETATPAGRVEREHYHCTDCRNGWTEDAPAGLYR